MNDDAVGTAADDGRDAAVPTSLTGSFEHDVLPLQSELYGYAYGLTRNRADAEDLVQDTLLKAFGAYGRLRPESFVKSWLLTIMKNTWISDHRAASRRPETLLGDVSEALPNVASDGHLSQCSAETELLRHAVDSDLAAAMEDLSDEMRTTVFHVVVQDMLCREVAELMGVPINTVLTRMHRSRRALRRSLADNAERRGSGKRPAA
jgi:RNA polymerase sigma-70 factor (ECF subfamily)